MQQILNPTHRIRDPIYGYIWLTDTELELVDTPVFQRLRRINQLALTKYVYPTAEHSRFVHSLGVVQAATNIFYEVLRFNPDIFNNDEQELQKQLQIVRFAALLHDIGHMPFSHAAEQVFLGNDFTHEDISKYIIQNNPSISKKLEKNGIKPQIVASLLKGKPLKEYALLKKFISGEFDADRADFLLRDSYFCGVKYGEYDYIRYAGSFRIIPGKDKQAVFAIEKGNLHAVEAFLLARYLYYLQVPFHRTRRGFDLVLERYFNDLWERGELPESGIKIDDSKIDIDFDRFQLFDDYTVFEQIKKDVAQKNPWALILMRQDRLHPVFDTERNDKGNENDFYDLQERLARYGLKENQDFFCFSKEVAVHKILENSDEMGEGSYAVMDKAEGNKLIGTILDHSSLLISTKKNSAYIRRIYLTSSAREKAKQVLSQFRNDLDAREKRKQGGK
ncbi:MAG: HD domain-containing protein [Desulfobacula sp.]|jgi:HD superfamily phosphohydrolase|nr:HD domain-containing protein [Desulfobacula sp.]